MVRQKNDLKQKGFVAIVVAALIMVILALITIGFTRIMQREQRQALDRQLSRQALYAAESGINEVYEAIRLGEENPDSPFFAEEKTDCDPSDLVGQGVLSDEGDIVYTCVQYDKNPPTLYYDISPGKSEIMQLVTGTALTDLVFDWGVLLNENDTSDNAGLADLSTCNSGSELEFQPSRSSSVPLLRIDITNFDPTNFNRSNLINNTEYIYAAPCNNGDSASTTTLTFDSSNNSRGDLVSVKCSTKIDPDYPCRLTLDGLSSATYVARVVPVYKGSSVRISGTEIGTTADETAEFIDAQLEVDVTARSNDIVRRLRGSISYSSLRNITGIPEAVIHSYGGVCKLLSVDENTPDVINSCL